MLQETEKPQILIIDDEEGIRFMLETKFSRSGYRVAVAANGLHALQKIKANLDVDLIVCDLKMPGMTGLELYNELKGMNSKIPFLMITGFAEEHRLKKAASLGINTILVKPVNQSALMTHVEEMLADYEPKEKSVKNESGQGPAEFREVDIDTALAEADEALKSSGKFFN